MAKFQPELRNLRIFPFFTSERVRVKANAFIRILSEISLFENMDLREFALRKNCHSVKVKQVL
jgi:hypothetical protein